MLGVPFVLWILLVCALLVHVILEHTKLGRYAFAIGSNPEAAFYAGIPVAFTRLPCMRSVGCSPASPE